jgi:PEP-CTERM motif
MNFAWASWPGIFSERERGHAPQQIRDCRCDRPCRDRSASTERYHFQHLQPHSNCPRRIGLIRPGYCDNATDITDQTSGITVNQISFTVNSSIGFRYEQSEDILLIGGLQSSVGGAGGGSFDFIALFRSASSVPTITTGELVIYQGGGTTIIPVITDAPTSVPEPASLATFGAGLLGLGLVRRKRARREACLDA